jgi:hypothetical protein
MKQLLIKIGKFTRLIDENNTLSITQIACMIVLFKLALAPSTNIIDLGTLLVTLGHYSVKKYLNINNSQVNVNE